MADANFEEGGEGVNNGRNNGTCPLVQDIFLFFTLSNFML